MTFGASDSRSPARGLFAEIPSTNRPGPPFSIQHQAGVDWLVAPDGSRFFSLGACVVTTGIARDKFDIENPGYASWKHHAEPRAWADAALKRLKSWGFTTVGGWGEFETLRASPEMHLAFTPVLHIGSTAGAPWWDMWDARVIQRMDDIAREQILAVREDPRLLGYYSDNELGWWNATLFKMTLEQPPTSGQRQRLIALLRETYASDWSRLAADFEPEAAGDWTELEQRGMLFLRPGGDGIRVLRRFLGLLAERYYSLTHDIIRKYDRRALILGDRFQSFYYPEVARAAAPHLDAISSNLNAQWNDGTFLRCYLETLHALTRKPVLVSEFYMAARENRSGNRNDHGLFPVVPTQRERADAFRRTLMALARTPYALGADWFQYADEPSHGRDDGENFNFGLVDIHDRPYAELTAAAASLDLRSLKSAPPAPRLDASAGVPRAPKKPMANFEPGRALQDWDREGGFVKPASEFPMADLYICWNRDALFLGLYSLDIVEDAYYHNRFVPKADRAEWTVRIAGRDQPVRARLGAGLAPLINEPSARVSNLSGVNLDVRNIACLELPARLFGRSRLRAGDTVEFVATLTSHAQAYRVEWRGIFTLR